MPATHDHQIRGFLDSGAPDALDYVLLESTNRARDSEFSLESIDIKIISVHLEHIQARPGHVRNRQLRSPNLSDEASGLQNGFRLIVGLDGAHDHTKVGMVWRRWIELVDACQDWAVHIMKDFGRSLARRDGIFQSLWWAS